MSADLYLNAIEGTERNVSLVQAVRDLQFSDDGFIEYTDEYAKAIDRMYSEVEDRVHIGEVSFAKAMAANDRYWIPAAVTNVLNVFGGEFIFKNAGRALSADVTASMNAPDRSHYRTWHRRSRGPSRRRAVKQFFARNDGLLVFAAVE